MFSFLESLKSTEKPISEIPTNFYHPFQLPITYLDPEHIHHLSPTVAADLELEVSEKDHTMYQYLLLANGDNDNRESETFSTRMIKEHAKYFTTHVPFLTDTQKIIQNLPMPSGDEVVLEESVDGKSVEESVGVVVVVAKTPIQKTWEEITLTKDFKEKFNFVEFRQLDQFNRSSLFLECLSLMHLSSPIFSVLFFIIFLIAPIALMTMTKTPFTMDNYFFHLAGFSKVSFLGKMAKSISAYGLANYQSIGMIGCCIVFYGVQFYNSYVSYHRFWRNMEIVNNHLLEVRDFAKRSIVRMENFLVCVRTSAAHSYNQFCSETQRQLQTLGQIHEWVKNVEPFGIHLQKLREFGDLLQCYYELYCNEEYDLAIRYAAGFGGYENHLLNLQRNLKLGHLSCADFSVSGLENGLENGDEELDTEMLENGDEELDTEMLENGDEELDTEMLENDSNELDTESEKPKEKPKVKKVQKKPDNQIFEMYYPAHDPKQAIKNNCDLGKNMIITGPNASGKTTFLKSAALNLIFTQQFGMGCYSHAVIYRPYTHFHTYLNIPDSSDRDSLFQAEARRGKEILDAIVSDSSGDGAADVSAICSTSGCEIPSRKTLNKPSSQNAFLLMDELFSGTNHDDAVSAAYGFLCYLGKQERQESARFMLTTHFVEICDHIEANMAHVADNYQMTVKFGVDEDVVDGHGDVGDVDQELQYLYKIQKGISNIRCGVHILKQMKYPKEVLSYAQQTNLVC
jgi:energy-coupling factor transporter ATP-binding protein EcfA2